MATWGIDLGVRSFHLARLDEDGSLTVRSIYSERAERWREIKNLAGMISSPFERGDKVFIEEPPMVRSAQVHGQMHQIAGMLLVTALPAQAYLVNVKTWKSDLVGNGNAAKTVVAQWLNDHHARYSAICAEDQDLIDATCVALYGHQVLQRL